MAPEKIALSVTESFPVCPWCDAVLDRVRWHKVRRGPPVAYLIVVSCHRCRAVLDCLSGGDRAAGAGAMMS